LLFPLPAVILFPKTGTQSKMTREQWLRSGAIYQEVQKAAERREGEPQAVQHKTGIFAMKRRNLISHLSSPSKSMMDFADELTQEPKSLALDAGCGFGRNAVALALRGLSVVCVDHDAERLWKLVSVAPDCIDLHKRPGFDVGRLYPICAELNCLRWPFAKNCFSAIICVHFIKIELLELFRSSLVPGGHLYIETFGGQGRNYLDLPKAGQLHELLSEHFHLPFYRERPVGPPGCRAVSAKLLAQRKNL
jgi:SAM-dependent methyltransferase